MRLMRRARSGLRRWLSASLWLGASLVGCGARTTLDLEEDEPDATPPAECLFDEDCPTTDRCQPMVCNQGMCETGAAVSCDDGDSCTEDSCDPATGACRFRALAFDQDGDGFKGPRAGFAPGSEGSCGNDCDDTSPDAFPGGQEICDGVDNDCNGVIDDGAGYQRVSSEPWRLSHDDDSRSGAASLTYDGEHWAVALWADHTRREFRFLSLSPDGTVQVETPLTNHNGGSYGGPIVWTGSVFGTAWPDNRQDQSIDVYFNLLDRKGAKLGPDLRVTATPEFSTDPIVRYDGSEWVVFWGESDSGFRSLKAQHISTDSELLGDPVTVSPPGVFADLASLDFGTERLGVAFQSVDPFDPGAIGTLNFMSLSQDLSGEPTLIAVDSNPGGHQVRHVADRFILVWSQYDGAAAGEYVYGATFDEFGNPLEPKTPLTPGGKRARSPSLLPLGDRALLFWADQVEEGNYELYVKTIDRNLNELSPPERLTFAGANSLGPVAAFGPNGQVGVVFEDYRDGGPQAFMLRLECVPLALE